MSVEEIQQAAAQLRQQRAAGDAKEGLLEVRFFAGWLGSATTAAVRVDACVCWAEGSS